MSLGKKIKEYRQKAGLTQKELADKLYVTYQAVSKWENDDSEPSIDLIKTMCEMFNCTTDDLINPDKKTEKPEEKPVEVVERVIVKEPDPILAVCQGCGKPIYHEENLHRVTVSQRVGSIKHHHTETLEKILCSDCRARMEQQRKDAEKRAAREKDERIRKKIKLAYVIPALVTSLFVIIAVVLFIKKLPAAKFFLVVGILLFPTIACFILGNNVVGETWVSIASWSIKLPGVIFTWDIEGCAFFIAMKIFFAIVGFLFGVGVFCFATAVAMLISIFIYPSALARMYKGDEYEKI